MNTRYTPWMELLSVPFYDLTWQQAEGFLRQFVQRIPERIQELESYIRSSPGFEHWRADSSEKSLGELGPWLLTVLRSKVLEAEEKVVEIWNPKLPKESVEAMERAWKEQHVQELLPESEALLVDCGIYFCECVRERVPSTRWGRCKRKMDRNFNFPLLLVGTNSGYNPLLDAVNIGVALVEGRRGANVWNELYASWANIGVKTEHERAKWKATKSESD